MSATDTADAGPAGAIEEGKGVKRRLSEPGDIDGAYEQEEVHDVEVRAALVEAQLEEAAAASEASAPQELPLIKYEYLDHTADIQIHAWGDTLQEAYEQAVMAMFAYMTNIETVDNLCSEQIHAEGHDLVSLLFSFLDEFLFIFSADPNFIARKVAITSFDRDNFKIDATGYGETFNLAKHPQGTEVKAITYSNMQVHESEGFCEVFVIIDI